MSDPSLNLNVSDEAGGPATSIGVTVTADTLAVRHRGRLIAILDRDLFRSWLGQDHPHEPLVSEQTRWTFDGDGDRLTVSLGYVRFVVHAASVADLRTAL